MIDQERLEEALYANSTKRPARTHRQALKASIGETPDDEDIEAFAKKVELLLGALDDDLTVADLREALHTRSMRGGGFS